MKSLFRIVVLLTLAFAMSAQAADSKTIVLVAGDTAKVDKLGHHDYLAGCALLADLLQQTEGMKTVFVKDGWPEDENILKQADAIVFYTDGGGKQAYLSSPERVATLQALVDRGVGLSFFHQAIDYPEPFTAQATSWLGGTYVNGKGGRGHWITDHKEFPKHPVTRGVTRWEAFDGWLNGVQFVEGMKGITPLVWSGKKAQGSPEGGDADIVGWVYERPDGGRSFSFSGIDAHSAFSLAGMRQFVVNGILWTAKVEIPKGGAKNEITEEKLASYQTPRTPPQKKK